MVPTELLSPGTPAVGAPFCVTTEPLLVEEIHSKKASMKYHEPVYLEFAGSEARNRN